MTNWCAFVSLTLVLAATAAWGAPPPRSKSLAQFDNGYAQCEKRDPAMKGHRDDVYASLYRLKLDDDLRKQLDDTRKSAPYKSERRRAQQTLAKSGAASDVQHRLDQQCAALKKELKPAAAPASAPQR
ncbi:MAG TPA: hypothetical protein VML58_10265 [Burkholderiaceae bacterium]|nr:hypothetical protein [Burkholderiaceae bacterium]